MNYLHLKNVSTGNVFKMPEIDAREILRTDRGNYICLEDDTIERDMPTIHETSTFNLVVEDENSDNDEKDDDIKPLEKCTIPELQAKLEQLNIEYSKKAQKAELIALLCEQPEEKTPTDNENLETDEETTVEDENTETDEE